MEKQIKKVLIVTNFNIYDKANAAIAVAEKLVGCGCEVCSPVYNKDKIIRMRGRARFSFLPVDESYKSVDAVIVLGGDGTILESARRAAPFGVPVMGLNLGRLGYMAELEMSELDEIARIVSGDYKLEKRSMLNIELLNANGETRKNEYALNDAVLSNGTISRVVDLELYEGSSKIANYRADGMIISTPTGSTAYSLAAGGAIVDPRLACFCVTPICPHSLLSRPLVFPDSACLEIKNVCHREKTLFLTVDGRVNYELVLGEAVRITRSPLTTSFIRLKEESFYEKLRQKMNDN
ncbi:MAG: NAD(+)/NADH kinase [Clostridia bacterium]|nr:NAD(+)/NADH kinase [Clostridia bacterium]MBR4032802.1 NAD(+)/NADH kinase [Clostridia bacterium]